MAENSNFKYSYFMNKSRFDEAKIFTIVIIMYIVFAVFGGHRRRLKRILRLKARLHHFLAKFH